jgi:hypothetical protein
MTRTTQRNTRRTHQVVKKKDEMSRAEELKEQEEDDYN